MSTATTAAANAPAKETGPLDGQAAILVEAITWLRDLARDRVGPAEAQRALEALRAAHSDLELDLIEQPMDFDRSHDYQLLIGGPGGDVVALAISGAAELPWPLRGVQRWSNDHLGSVNGRPVLVNDALVTVECLGSDPALVRRLIDASIIETELQLRPVSPSDADIAEATAAIRRGLGLLTADSTRRWLAERGFADTVLWRRGELAARLFLFKRRLAAGRIDATFAAHQESFAQVQIITLTMSAVSAMSDGGVEPRVQGAADLAAMARRLLDDRVPFTMRHLARTPLIRCEPAVQAAVAGLSVGEIATVATAEGCLLVQLVDRRPATLDATTLALVEERILTDWLRERRQAADVHWYWGPDDLLERAIPRHGVKLPLKGFIPRP